jgi:hypothetical protein
MEQIRIRNIRSLKDTGNITLSPLTLLVGKNSSGKSTFARMFPLLRQSVEARTVGPILWNGDYSDFGNFNTACNRRSADKTMFLDFSFNLTQKSVEGYWRYPYWGGINLLEETKVSICLGLASDGSDGRTYVSRIEIGIFEDDIAIYLDKNGKATDYYVNNVDMISVCGEFGISPSGKFIPVVKPQKIISEIKNRQRTIYLGQITSPVFVEEIKNCLKLLFHKGTSDTTIESVILNFGLGSKETFLDRLRKQKSKATVWRRRTEEFTVDTPIFNQIRNLYLASTVSELLNIFDDHLVRTVRNVRYMDPIRATAERFYREQDLAVDEIDCKGKNLAMFLRSLSDTERLSFKNWTLETLGFEVYSRRSGGHIALTLIEEGSKSEYNFTDMGFGFSQILPIVAQLWAMTIRPKRHSGSVRIFVIEQPELHLHPNLQAKVADMFVAAISAAKRVNVDLRVIVETHSEAIVNRIGNRIGTAGFNKDDVSVVVFDKKEADADTDIAVASYTADGFLENWPYGFFQPED